jgi:hypothetical protein
MAIPATKQPEHFIAECNPAPTPIFFCESCLQPIVHLDDITIEQEYGFEGEAWGSVVRQGSIDVAITKCCRASIVDGYGEPIDAYTLREEL